MAEECARRERWRRERSAGPNDHASSEWGDSSHREAAEGLPGLQGVGRNGRLCGLVRRQNLRRQRLPRVKVRQLISKTILRRQSIRCRAIGISPACGSSGVGTFKQRLAPPKYAAKAAGIPMVSARAPVGPGQGQGTLGGPEARTCARGSCSALVTRQPRWEGDQIPSQGDPESADARA